MPASHDGVSGEDARRIDEEFDREDERARAARRDDRRRLYRSTLPLVAAVFFAAAILWALTGAILPFLQESVFSPAASLIFAEARNKAPDRRRIPK